jgi:hypothetical protein
LRAAHAPHQAEPALGNLALVLGQALGHSALVLGQAPNTLCCMVQLHMVFEHLLS